jgi:hypothetical protein
MKVLTLILVSLAWAAACPAALEWKTTGVQLTARPGQEAISVAFPFRNTGDKTVRILSLDPSCSCMSAAADKPVYAPGEQGEVRVELALAGYSGRVHRSVLVSTDDAKGGSLDLTMTVEIPELVVITPRFVFWRVGDKPEAKVIDVVVTDPGTATPGEVDCANARFQARLSVRKTGTYQLSVRPTDTREPDEAMVHLNFNIGGKLQTYVVYAAVK